MARVLVVDDEPSILNLVELRLRKHGHRVIAVGSGAAALEVVEQRGAPDVAVVDVAMPEMNGLELLQALRSREGLAELPVVFLSARVQPEDIEAGRALGATYLTKPFVATALLEVVENACEPSEVGGGW